MEFRRVLFRSLAPAVCLPDKTRWYSEFGYVWYHSRSPSPSSALPPSAYIRRSTSIDFAENQLFPGLIGLSPLNTTHPSTFQRATVRSSSACYRTFNLVMPRSPGFGSNASYSVALFRLAFAAPTPNGLSLHDTLSHCRSEDHTSELQSLMRISYAVF